MSQPSDIVTGKLYKKSKGEGLRTWIIRDFTFDKQSRKLTYSSKGVIKGSVQVSDRHHVKPHVSKDGDTRDYEIDIYCMKIETDGTVVDGIKRYQYILT